MIPDRCVLRLSREFLVGGSPRPPWETGAAAGAAVVEAEDELLAGARLGRLNWIGMAWSALAWLTSGSG
jgi:hypothetical protein